MDGWGSTGPNSNDREKTAMIFRRLRDAETLKSWGAETATEINQPELHCLIWNVYKGARQKEFSHEAKAFIQGKDLVLLQEVVADESMPTLLEQICPHWTFQMAQSFRMRQGHSTGVLIGGHTRPNGVSFIRSTEREFFFFTPKMTLFAEFLWNGSKVLVVCTHVVNFVTTGAFTKSIYEICERIKSHDGPVVMAGDFNTWSVKRSLILKQILGDVGLRQIDFEKDERLLQLDHVFVRGISVQFAKILSHSVGSDHYPLEVRLALD